MEIFQHFLTILIPLIIITDPPGNLPFFLLFTEQNTLDERRKMAAIASSSAALILIFFALTGDFVLRFFNIGLPAFQIAGGFIFFIYALQMLCLIPSNIKATQQEEKEGIEKQNVALVPLATPLIAGPGAITAVLVWRHNPESSLSTPLLLLAIIIACLLIYIVFYFGEWIRKMLGVGGIRVVSRLMGLLLAVIAVQFMVTGFQQLC
ncbi:MAG: MarC family protein [Proteobacteria bacterium]|nr:MarC family protein [Desulfobacteraceae bacterium]MBU4012918.1 MarC family protein [Pseudomonadota bacterium]MBU4066957.1 MarC family protein [Pseudomonadota bacterium]MBU4099799.1 MarC family protein [Pseudomonadota bacterium]